MGCLDLLLGEKKIQPGAAASLQQQGMASCAAAFLQTGECGKGLTGSKKNKWRPKSEESSGDFSNVAMDRWSRSGSSTSMQQVDSGQVGEVNVRLGGIEAAIKVLHQDSSRMNEALIVVLDEVQELKNRNVCTQEQVQKKRTCIDRRGTM